MQHWTRSRRCGPWVAAALVGVWCASWVAPAAVAEVEEAIEVTPSQSIDTVLSLGRLPVDPRAWADSGQQSSLVQALHAALERGPLAGVGRSLRVFGQTLTWQALALDAVDAERADGLTLWAIHLDSHRFVQGHLHVEGLQQPQVLFSGAVHSVSPQGVPLNLASGTHVLWLLHQGIEPSAAPSLRWQGKQAHDRIAAHIKPTRRVSAQLLTNAETVSAMALSADGRALALSRQGRWEAADAEVRETVIVDLDSGRQLDSWTGTLPRSLLWSPDGRWLAIHANDGLWLRAVDSGQMRLLLANPGRVSGWRWHPNNQSLLFTWTTADDSDQRLRRRFRSLEDRWVGFRDNSQLFELDIDSGLVRPLTAMDSSVHLHDIHPDGQRLLLSQRVIDYAEPPHSLFALFELDLTDLSQRSIVQLRQFDDIQYADQGFWLLAGPGLHLNGQAADGSTTEAPLVPNEYDTQLYRLSADGSQARSVSRALDPALGGMQRLGRDDLLLTATRGDHTVLLQWRQATQQFIELDSGFDVVEQVVVSERDPVRVVARGTRVTTPQRLHQIDFDRRGRAAAPSPVRGLQAERYADVRFGEVRDWSFTNESGDEIDGRYYLPPDFDPQQRYPMIVYYYGGTTPVNRQFTGRYPVNLWAAKGYVVYVLQPRGTIGYGQRFSALHVNAWGRYTADDIIAGTQAFVAAHDFVDGDRIGNIGASYGGFMTMHLATLTDLYAASVSHAGISALTNYWGQGWWGYGYSGIASRGSFPWNNPELYVGQSPIYQADRITTPLLLVTGDADTNVPPGESHNMFTALRLLGREVELIEFPGEDHWILDRAQRYVWWDTMLAWFDRWLKDEPEWWQHLYPDS